MNEQSPQTRTTWMVLFGGFAFSLVIYYIVAQLVSGSRPDTVVDGGSPGLWPLQLGAAALLLLGVLLVLPRSLVSEQTEPSRFTQRSVIAGALCDAVGVIGLVVVLLGRAPDDYLPFGVIGLAVLLFYVLPLGLQYWRLRASSGNVPGGRVGGGS